MLRRWVGVITLEFREVCRGKGGEKEWRGQGSLLAGRNEEWRWEDLRKGGKKS